MPEAGYPGEKKSALRQLPEQQEESTKRSAITTPSRRATPRDNAPPINLRIKNARVRSQQPSTPSPRPQILAGFPEARKVSTRFRWQDVVPVSASLPVPTITGLLFHIGAISGAACHYTRGGRVKNSLRAREVLRGRDPVRAYARCRACTRTSGGGMIDQAA